jgi:hypothetical protein
MHRGAKGIDMDYRRPGDPRHIVRVNQPAPKGCPRKLKEFVQVAGVTHKHRQSTVRAFIDGSERRVELIRDPTNEVDPNAVRVVGSWTDESGEALHGKPGWLPKAVAAELAAKHPSAPIRATVKAMFRARAFKSAGLRIDVWGPRRKRKRPAAP